MLQLHVKCNFIKLHILTDEESQKILAFRVTDTGGDDTRNLPGMLDQAMNRLGIPLEDRSTEPAMSVEANSTPADDNSIETITEYVYGCCQTISKDASPRWRDLWWPSYTVMAGTTLAGTTLVRPSPTAKSVACAPPYMCTSTPTV